MFRGMRLENAFSVPAPVEQAWSVLLDVERVATCLPGASIEGADGAEFAGAMTVKLGPVTSRYGGTVRIERADAVARHAVLRAQARDARGDGTAAATIATRLEPEGDGTRVHVVTDLQLSGPAAQFGRGVMQDVSRKLMAEFADCLAVQLGGDAARPAVAAEAAAGDGTPSDGHEDTRVGRLPLGPAGDAALAAARARAGAATNGSRPAADVLDLGAASRGALLKRAVPVAVVLGAAAVIAVRARRR
jgi:carbon monoxide dehydrogenase subunit G